MDNKVLILTLIEANNVGAYLQAFSMQEALRENGYDAEFGVLPTKNDQNAKSSGRLGKIKKLLFSGNLGKLLFKAKDSKKYAKARKKLALSKFDSEKEYTSAVIGSDEVWNINSKSFYHHPQYFGKDIKAKKIVSYAPSVGNMTAQQAKEAGVSFEKFTALSVRDENGFNVVKEIDGRIPALVVDPTFLVSSLDKFVIDKPCKKDYILVYNYNIDEDCIKKVKSFAKKASLPLYSVGTYNKWCDKNISVDPFEFLGYLKNAKYVITSTFHGTALSINFNKQFVSFVNQSAKLINLLQTFGLEQRIVNSDKDISTMFETEIDYNEVNEVIKAKRQDSLKFLLDGLSE
ncbi:MAG: polysaccharide pyruvyl transferase family protein [Clostridiales bacterium]|nr:polysaccharide pyruvyl transferase family protein [Clostridiales bacterium]